MRDVMLSTVYFYVSIQYYTKLSEADELKDLLFKMKIIDQNKEYLYDIEIDELSKHIFLELSADGYKYLNTRLFETFEVTLRKVVFYISPAYKFRRG